MQKKTFRLFISSPFSDFIKEREVLHKRVFPKIDDYCIKSGFSFQPIDLRWGVNEEAQLDQKTIEVCLEEVRACKHFPSPNFLIMAGDRYGYIPCPYMIEKVEFEKILKYYIRKYPSKLKVEDCTEQDILKQWYKLDQNQIYRTIDNRESIAYILQPRTDKYAQWEIWEKEENLLRSILQNAVTEISNSIENIEYQKYFTSATEAEVLEGIVSYKDITSTQMKLLEHKVIEDSNKDKKYIYGYLRTIKNSNGIYIDKEKKLEIKAEEFKNNIENILTPNALRSNFSSIEEYENSSLKEFEEFIYEKLKKAIDKQYEESLEITPLKKERLEQEKFQQDKLRGFQGRKTILNKIATYISKNGHNQPLVIHGPSGMGKSSLMAKSIKETDMNLDKQTIIYRFVGATQNSTTIKELLMSVCDQLQEENSIDKIDKYEGEKHKFNKQIKEMLSSINHPTILFIDALDQLSFKDNLQWLPDILHSNLRIVLSLLNDIKYKEDSLYYNILSNKVNKKYLIDIKDDNLENQQDLIDNLLLLENKKLQKKQKENVLKKWRDTNYSPLYLKIAIEEIKHWKSCDKEDLELANNVENIVKEFLSNLSKLYHHKELLVKKVFGYIYTSKDGLSEKELLDVLSEDLEDEKEFQRDILNEFHKPIKSISIRRGKEELTLPFSIWSRLNTQLKPFIIEKNIDNQSLMKFFHREFNTVVKNYIQNEKETFHQKLSSYFYSQQDKGKTWNKRYYSLRMLSELPYQLYYAKNTKLLKEILFDLEFAGSTYNNYKQNSFRDILSKAASLKNITEDEIYPWKSFYREKEHLILRVDEELWKPHQSLFQLTYEDGLDSPLTKVSDKLLKSDKINWSWLKNLWRKKSYKRINAESIFNIALKESFKIVDIINEKYLVLESSNNLVIYNCLTEKLNIFNDFQYIENIRDDCVLLGCNKNHHGIFDIKIWDCEKEIIKYTISDDQLRYDGVLKLSNTKILLWRNKEGMYIYDLEKDKKQFKDMPYHVFSNYTLISKNKFAILSDKHLSIYGLYNGIAKNLLEYKDIQNFNIYANIKKRIWGDFLIIHPREYSYSSEIYNKNYDITLVNTIEKNIKNISIPEGYAEDIIILNDSKLLYWIYSPSYPNSISDVYIYNGTKAKLIYSIDLKICFIKKINEKEIIFVFDNYTFGLKHLNDKKIIIFKGHKNSITDVKLLKNGDIISLSKDKSLKIWNKTGDLKNSIISSSEYVDIKENISHIIATTNKGLIYFWNKKFSLDESKKEKNIVFDKTIFNQKIIISYYISDYSKKSFLFFKSINNEVLKKEEFIAKRIKNIISFTEYFIVILNSFDTSINELNFYIYTLHDGLIRKTRNLDIEVSYPDEKIHTETINNYLLLKTSEEIFILNLKSFNLCKLSNYSLNGYCKQYNDHSLLIYDGKKLILKNFKNKNERLIYTFIPPSNDFNLSLVGNSPLVVYWSHIIDRHYSFNSIYYYKTHIVTIENIVKNTIATLDLKGCLIRDVMILNESTIVYQQYIESYPSFISEVYMYDGKNKKLLHKTNLQICSIMKLDPDDLIFIFNDNTFGLKNIKNKKITIFKGHKDKILNIKCINKNYFISYSKDNTIRSWDNKGTQMRLINSSFNTKVYNFNLNKLIIDNNLYIKNQS